VAQPESISIQVSDVSKQNVKHVANIPADATVGELINGLLAQMRLPKNDVNGQALSYRARLEREGRHLHASERVGDALQTDDRITLQPNIDAGRER
jgi:hypothetical protein